MACLASTGVQRSTNADPVGQEVQAYFWITTAVLEICIEALVIGGGFEFAT